MKKNIRQACFACTTPYQTIGAISITRAQKLDADLYIFGMFEGYEEVAERLRKHHVFANVYAIDNKKFRLPEDTAKTYFTAFWQMLFVEHALAGVLPQNICYETFYSTSRAHGKTLLQAALKKRNPNMAEVIFEDGTGSYVYTSRFLCLPSKMKGIMEKMLGWNLFAPDNCRIMVNLPELLNLPEEFRDCPVSKMPPFVWDAESREMMMEVFGAAPQMQISQETIIFDTVRGIGTNMEGILRTLDDCYRVVTEVIGSENSICKPHPRSIQKPSMEIYSYSGIPMEVLYLGMEDIQDRLLIGYNSTALFTPKMLFHKEPRVILLHRIVEGGASSTASEQLYRNMKAVYSDPNRVSAPNNLMELKECLLQYQEGEASNEKES